MKVANSKFYEGSKFSDFRGPKGLHRRVAYHRTPMTWHHESNVGELGSKRKAKRDASDPNMLYD